MPKKKSNLKKKKSPEKSVKPLKTKARTKKKPTAKTAKAKVSRTTPKKKPKSKTRKQTQNKAAMHTVKASNTPKAREKRSKNSDREDRVRALAHHKWREAGCPISDGVEFWLAAEQHVDAEGRV
jgi:hypothetical protein